MATELGGTWEQKSSLMVEDDRYALGIPNSTPETDLFLYLRLLCAGTKPISAMHRHHKEVKTVYWEPWPLLTHMVPFPGKFKPLRRDRLTQAFNITPLVYKIHTHHWSLCVTRYLTVCTIQSTYSKKYTNQYILWSLHVLMELVLLQI